MLGRGRRHRYLKHVVSHHAAKAGCLVTRVREASTSELLENEFTPEECSKMFSAGGVGRPGRGGATAPEVIFIGKSLWDIRFCVLLVSFPGAPMCRA
jgi:hypothetical protein